MRLPILLTTALPFVLGACWQGGAQGGAGGKPASPTASDFVLKTIEGRQVALSDHVGRNVILLNFYGSWCSACEAKLTHLERFHRTYRDRGLLVLGISIDGPETIAVVAPQARRMGVTFPVLLDEETRVAAVYDPQRTVPFSVLIDRDGRIRWVRPGFLPGDELLFEHNIKALLIGGLAPPAVGR
jgi:peroxiredoxin